MTMKADIDVFAKLDEDGFGGRFEAEAFSGREVEGHGDFLNVGFGHGIEIGCSRQPSSDAISSKHVPRYLAELQYRYNRRHDLGAMLPRLNWAAGRMPPMPYRLLKMAEVYA